MTGIGGWLGLLAFGQVVGLLRLIVSMGRYYATINDQIWKKFPTAMWGETALNTVGVLLAVYTTVLLFCHSRHFPRFFALQMIMVICLAFLDLLWIAFIIAESTGQSIASNLTLEAKEGGQIVAGVIGALIWIPYVMRSRRSRIRSSSKEFLRTPATQLPAHRMPATVPLFPMVPERRA